MKRRQDSLGKVPKETGKGQANGHCGAERRSKGEQETSLAKVGKTTQTTGDRGLGRPYHDDMRLSGPIKGSMAYVDGMAGVHGFMSMP